MIVVVVEQCISHIGTTLLAFVDTDKHRKLGKSAAEYADILEQLPNNGETQTPYGKYGIQSEYPPEPPQFPCVVDKCVTVWAI